MSTRLSKRVSSQARRLRLIEAVTVMGMNHAEAAAYAGFSRNSVSQILADPKVRRYIHNLQKSEEKRLNISRSQAIQGLLDAVEHAKLINEPAAEIQAWDRICKIQGHFAPERHIHDVTDDVRQFMRNLAEMDDAEVAKIARQDNLIELTKEDYEVSDDAS